MPTNFRDYVEQALSPTVLQGNRAQRLVSGGIGLMFDLMAETVNQSVKARFFGSNTFPADAMRYLGEERMLPRYPVDTDATYKARLQGAWEAWQKAGTDQGVVSQLEAMGLTAYIREQNIDWDWDGDSDNWSRFWVIITGHPWQRWLWGDGSLWAGGQTWGSTATAAEVRSIRALVRKWKPGHVVCGHIIVVFDEATWNAEQPDGTWGDPANRSKSAIYWPG